MSKKLWALAAASGILLSIPFLIPHAGWVSLFAFVPLFIAEALYAVKSSSSSAPLDSQLNNRESTLKNKSLSRASSVSKHRVIQNKPKRQWLMKFWPKALLAFLIWNAVTTFWVWNATPAGAICAVVLNSLQMLAIFQLFRLTARITSLRCNSTVDSGFSGGSHQTTDRSQEPSARSISLFPYFVFAALWIAWEHIYFTWNISWPWLNLGNSFARTISLVQWYEFTGVEGGSLWILLSNILIFKLLISTIPSLSSLFNEYQSCPESGFRKSCIITAVVIFAPAIISLVQYFNFKEDASAGRADFVVLQPNIDPYGDKFSGMTQHQQSSKLFAVAEDAIAAYDTREYIVVAPETFLYPHSWNEAIWEHIPVASEAFLQVHNWVGSHKGMNLIVGAGTYAKFDSDPNTLTATYMPGQNSWFEGYNTAIYMGAREELKFYHKSKLVTVVESTPWPKLMKWLESKGVTLAGSFGNYGVQTARNVFEMPLHACGNTSGCNTVAESGHESVEKVGSEIVAKAGCAICYESVFGDYYREWVTNGANVMTIITNDGWWGNTPGYTQHLSYASLRAIETRRAIARSANTGISAFIDQRGDIVAQTEWWKEGALKASLPLSNRVTVFVRYGDIIGRVAKFISMLMLLMLGVSVVMKWPELRNKAV